MMDWAKLAEHIDAATARAFVEAARHVIDAMLIEAERVKQTQMPTVRDYNSATLSREAPGGGWISDSEVRVNAQRMAEAISAERWRDGFISALRLFGVMGR